MRRGQLAYANSMIDRALRTYKAIDYRIRLAETTADLGEIQRRRGFLERAAESFNEARRLARSLRNEEAESKALLGIGDVYRQQGRTIQAETCYRDAQARMERLRESTEVEGILGVAVAAVRLARLAVFGGRLGEAASHLATANEAATTSSLATAGDPMLLLVEGQLLLTQGDFAQAEARFSDAHNQAEGQQQPLLAAEALLGLARTRLSRGELEAALKTYMEAGRQFRLVESTDGDGAAVLGTAQVLIGQAAWEEAIARCETALTRFNQSDDLIGQADAMLTLGLAHRGNGELDEASTDFEQALTLYEQQRQPLGLADARYERAGILLTRDELDAAMDELTKAIGLVEQVMNTLSTPQQWSMFLRQYADLYAQAAITQVQRHEDTQASTLLTSFVRIAGASEIVQRITAYETILSSGDELTEDQLRANKDLLKRLAQLRKGLKG